MKIHAFALYQLSSLLAAGTIRVSLSKMHYYRSMLSNNVLEHQPQATVRLRGTTRYKSILPHLRICALADLFTQARMFH